MSKKSGLLIFLLGAISVFAGPYDTWIYHRDIVVNATASGANITTNQANFPLLVRLTNANTASGSDVLSAAAAGGADLRFSDSTGATSLHYQIERWTSAAAEIWVSVPLVAGGANTKIRMFWGKTGQADSSNGAATFDTAANFRAVWHMNGATASSNENDATADALTATQNNNPGAQVAGAIGYARTVNGFSLTTLAPTGFGAPNAMYFSDVNNGWAVGNGGTIVTTTNGGATWTAQASGTTDSLFGVYFGSATTGIAVGQAGTLLMTTNGGTTWTAQTSGTTNDLYAVAFSPGRTDTAIAVGAAGTILTNNGNAIWTLSTNGANNFYALAFNKAIHTVAIAVGQAGTTYKTTTATSQANTTWTSISNGTTDLNGIGYVFSASATSSNIAYSVGVTGGVRKTSGGGTGTTSFATNTFLMSGAPTGNFTGAAFTDGNVGWMVGAGGAVYRTSLDTGNGTSGSGRPVWVPIASGTTQNLVSIQFPGNAGVGFILVSNGTLIKITYATKQYFQVTGSGAAPVGTGINFDEFTNYTVSAWVNPYTSDSTYHQILSKSDNQYTFQTGAGADAGHWEFTEYDNPASTDAVTGTGWNQMISSNTAIPATWHFVMGVRNGLNGTTSTLYVDGALVSNGTLVLASNTAARKTALDVDIGKSPDAGGPFDRYWVGALDEIEIANTSRSADWDALTYATQVPSQTVVTLGTTVGGLPVITTNPSTQSTTVGSSIFFNVSVTGAGPFTYKWIHVHGGVTDTVQSDLNVSALVDTLKKASVVLADTGTYAVLVSNIAGSVTSTSASLSVTAGPAITTNPASATVNVGGSNTFRVIVSATTSLVYKWIHVHGGVTDTLKRDTTTALTDSLPLTNIPLADTGYYAVIVSNFVGAATSTHAILTILTVPGAPGTVGGHGGTAGQITVIWTTPASNGGSAITSYKVTAVQDTSKHCTSTGADSCIVTGLSNTTGYTFTVVAINAVGTGAGTTSTTPVVNIFGFSTKNGFSLQMRGSSMLLRMPAIAGDVHVSIVDVWGRTVWSRTVSGSIGQLSWNGQSSHGFLAPVGMYVLRLSMMGDANQPIVLQKTFVKQ